MKQHLDDQKGENVLSNHEPKLMGTQRTTNKKVLNVCTGKLTIISRFGFVLPSDGQIKTYIKLKKKKGKCREYLSTREALK